MTDMPHPLKTALLLAACLLGVQAASAQLKDEPPRYGQAAGAGDTSHRIPLFRPETHALVQRHYKDSHACQVLFLGVRFRVDRRGNVRDVACSENTPAFLREPLAENLARTSGRWSVRRLDGAAVDSQPVVLTYFLSVEPTDGQEDPGDLLAKATAGLPALEFGGGGAADHGEPWLHGTLHKPLLVRVRIFNEGYGK